MRLIIDGYNFIRQSPTLLRIEARSLEEGRLSLIRKLATYKRVRGNPVVVVFDAGRAGHASVEEERMGGVQIFYSAAGQSADEVIINLARNLRESAVIVSSDRMVLDAARGFGCGILKSDEFEKKLKLASAFLEAGRDDDEDKPRRVTTVKKGPAKRLSKKERKNRRLTGGV